MEQHGYYRISSEVQENSVFGKFAYHPSALHLAQAELLVCHFHEDKIHRGAVKIKEKDKVSITVRSPH